MTEKEQCEAIAIYLADVLAASAFGLATKKSTSRSERRRQTEICQTALDSLKAGVLVNRFGPRPKESVITRLEEVLVELKKT